MSVKSLNKVMLIGNLTRDPELRYTPSGTAVCTIGLATNRSWTTDGGEKKEETEYHRIIAWSKLAELCSQLLVKGRKIFVEGRLQTRNWTAADGTQKTTTEIVIDDMILLDSRRPTDGEGSVRTFTPAVATAPAAAQKSATLVAKQDDVTKEKVAPETQAAEAPKNEDINPDDIPF